MNRIIVTGSSGFLGGHLVRTLKDFNYPVVETPYLNLSTQDGINAFSTNVYPTDTIIHCASKVGGIRYNLENAAKIYHNNILMNTMLIDRLAKIGIHKLIFISSVCAYPQDTSIPTREDELFNGRIELSNEAYGMSKLAALVQLRSSNLNFSYPLLANLYGPDDRGFSHKDKAHLIPNLIKKFITQPEQVVMFGDGKLTRDMLYVEDAVRAIIKMIDIDYTEPINIATGKEVSKLEIVNAIVNALDYQGQVVWDGKPDQGELRRCYDVAKAKEVLSWQAETDIFKGIKKTVEWYSER